MKNKSVLGEEVRDKNGEEYEAKLFPHIFFTLKTLILEISNGIGP